MQKNISPEEFSKKVSKMISDSTQVTSQMKSVALIKIKESIKHNLNSFYLMTNEFDECRSRNDIMKLCCWLKETQGYEITEINSPDIMYDWLVRVTFR